MFELSEYVKNALKWALDAAERLAKDTTNPIDDIVVSAASAILKRAFGIESEE